MRVREYADAYHTAKRLHDIVTDPEGKKYEITGQLREDYITIVRARRSLLKSCNMRVYALGSSNDNVYRILVICDGIKRELDFAGRGVGGSINCIIKTGPVYASPFAVQNSDTVSDVCIIVAGSDILDDIAILCKTYYDAMCIPPSDDLYYMYCFFNEFRGLYTDEDIKNSSNHNFLNNRAKLILKRLLDHNPIETLDELTIAKVTEQVDSELENTGSPTE